MDKIIIKAKKEIKNLNVQGATAVAEAIISALKKYGQKLKKTRKADFQKKLQQAAKELLTARPTEPLSQNAWRFIRSRLSEAKSFKEAQKELQRSANRFLKLIKSTKKNISLSAEKIIKENENIFTHCHSSLVELTLKAAKHRGKSFKVFNTETRPLFQGHITARHLLKAKIPVTMVGDSSAGFLISKFSGQDLMMQKVIIGSDAILSNGSVINKIGSFGIGLAAFYERVPLYIIASLLKFTDYSWIKIEKRSPREIWSNPPKELKVINFAFDVVPAKFITGIVCEAGIIKPQEVKKKIKEIYPWLLEK